jgi:tetratricopeptide (TPR) repeat protein
VKSPVEEVERALPVDRLTKERKHRHNRKPSGGPAAEAAALARIEADPLDAEAYRALARARTKRVAAEGLVAPTVMAADPRMRHAARALAEGDLPTAEAIARAKLIEDPTNVPALRLLAEIGRQLALVAGTESLLLYALELDPTNIAAKLDLARLYRFLNRNEAALGLLDDILSERPLDENVLYQKAMVLGETGRSPESAELLGQMVRRSPHTAQLWAYYGRALKTVGQTDEGVEALRHATQIDPALGEAWWSLSDLKTVRLSADDARIMEDVLVTRELDEKDRYYIHFALGKAYEDLKSYEQSFTHYAEGNRLRRLTLDYDSGRLTRFVDAAVATFDERFFAQRKGTGASEKDPIFIVGMTRAGSTLIEQILASHPQVEGTMELAEMLTIARDLSEDFVGRVAGIAGVVPDHFRSLGKRYLKETRQYRHSRKPRFVDKMPNNWLSVPLIHLALPNARIIDARRHPLACCFSNFKQNFGKGHDFTYALADLGSYYSNYVRLMAHYDRVLPGRVYRLVHERLVDEPEEEVRRLLDYLDLPFDPACLRFYENKRAVRTPSAEQVRRPITKAGVDVWRNYEPWLGPLKAALGPVLDSYPNAPDFDAA